MNRLEVTEKIITTKVAKGIKWSDGTPLASSSLIWATDWSQAAVPFVVLQAWARALPPVAPPAGGGAAPKAGGG